MFVFVCIRRKASLARHLCADGFEKSQMSCLLLSQEDFTNTIWTGFTGSPLTERRHDVYGADVRSQTIAIYACGGDAYFNDGVIYEPKSDEWKRFQRCQLLHLVLKLQAFGPEIGVAKSQP